MTSIVIKDFIIFINELLNRIILNILLDVLNVIFFIIRSVN